MLHYSADKIISHRPTQTDTPAKLCFRFHRAGRHFPKRRSDFNSDIRDLFETGQLEGRFWQNHRP